MPLDSRMRPGTQRDLSSIGGSLKRTKRKIQAVLTVISLALVVFVAAGYSAAGKPSLSKKEVKALIASAKTKEDHLKLADFYKGEAVRFEAETKDHDEMAGMLRKKPTPNSR